MAETRETKATYPGYCRGNVRRITQATGADGQTAYAMMLMTAMLMDLRPEDPEVADIILADCGLSPECA